MSQGIKLSVIPGKYDFVKESAEERLDFLKEKLKEETINGFLFILIRPNGSYLIGQSDGLDRHRKIGILTEMISELIKA